VFGVDEPLVLRALDGAEDDRGERDRIEFGAQFALCRFAMVAATSWSSSASSSCSVRPGCGIAASSSASRVCSRGEQHGLLVREVVQHAGAGEPGGLRDDREAAAPVTARGEDLEGGAQDCVCADPPAELCYGLRWSLTHTGGRTEEDLVNEQASGDDGYFDHCPWLFAKQATAEQRAAQAERQTRLVEAMGTVRLGADCFVAQSAASTRSTSSWAIARISRRTRM
jgi:hypothetical protein